MAASLGASVRNLQKFSISACGIFSFRRPVATILSASASRSVSFSFLALLPLEGEGDGEGVDHRMPFDGM